MTDFTLPPSTETQDPTNYFFRASAKDFEKIPGSPLSYWMGSFARKAFLKMETFEQFAVPRQGMATSDVGRFIRFWYEIAYCDMMRKCQSNKESVESGKKWFPHNKGGEYRKWYGNNYNVVNWYNGGEEVLSLAAELYGSPTRTIKNMKKYFLPSVSWSLIGSGNISARQNDAGFIFDVAGPSAFPNQTYFNPVTGLLNSKAGLFFIKAINPTLNFNSGDIAKIPFAHNSEILEDLRDVIPILRFITENDWNNYETSWDFSDLPLLRSDHIFQASEDRKDTGELLPKLGNLTSIKGNTLSESWENLKQISQAMSERMQELEEENNRIWIEAYGLQDELTPEVPLKEITLTCNPWYRYKSEGKSADKLWKMGRTDAMQELLSYAVGCMMGRYSLDKPGLMLANAGEGLDDYIEKIGGPKSEIRSQGSEPDLFSQNAKLSFMPDDDGIIPILDGEWFADDVVARTREFLRVCWGGSNFIENLHYLEECLGKDLRSYFLNDFYKNHIGGDRGCGYKKRPIYWLFQSPKKGFGALVYLHRYNKDTVNTLLNRYLRPYIGKLEDRIRALDHEQAAASGKTNQTAARKEQDKLRKILKECQEWESEVIYPLAQQRIEIDLDDGVKVNYPKFGSALAKVVGLS